MPARRKDVHLRTPAIISENRTSTLPMKGTLIGGHGAAAAAPSSTLPIQLEQPVATAPDTPRASATRRTTVLPRRAPDGGPASFDMHPRFQRVKTLGEGAMGKVELVRDNDIRRTVAVKHLLGGTDSAAALARFADEVRVVGQLEHPGIVPIYDVDKGEDGQLYLVMKHLHGDTMEQVIERLRAGDSAYVARFSLETRVRIFLGVLDAVGYAHARGVLHRDLKPANIMIGPYGEVTVLDWGIAKPLRRATDPGSPDPLAPTLVEPSDARLLETQAGQLAGTPLYMSPEQAAGLNDDLDERSDVYTLCVLLYEWLALHHPLQDRQSVAEVLATLVLNDYTRQQLGPAAQAAGVPMEYLWLIVRGLVRNRDERYQTAKELEHAIKAVQDGKIKVQCEITLAKRLLNSANHWIDHHPRLYTALVRASVASVAAVAAAVGVFAALRILG